MQMDQIKNTEIKALSNAELATIDGGAFLSPIPEVNSFWPPYILPEQL